MNTLSHVVRGGISESRHAGYLAIADAYGRLIYTSGPLDEDRVAFMRSSAKPLQALPLLETGAAERFGLTPAEIALACASHNGEPEHTRQVQIMLDKAGLQREQLLCGAHYPYHQPTQDEMRRLSKKPNTLHSNCSGKHTGMLLVCKHMGWSLDNYTDLEHPLQQMILQTMADFSGVRPAEIATGIDGCSVVCFGITVGQMATAFARLADPSYWLERNLPQRADAVRRISEAMWLNSFNVAGSERGDTDLMSAVAPGRVFSKVGAEAVWCVGFPVAKLGLAMKIEDGGTRAEPVILAEALRQTHLLSETEIQTFEAKQVKPLRNVRGIIVGEHKATLELRVPEAWEMEGCC